MKQTETQTRKNLQELIVYSAVNREFKWANIYAIKGV